MLGENRAIGEPAKIRRHLLQRRSERGVSGDRYRLCPALALDRRLADECFGARREREQERDRLVSARRSFGNELPQARRLLLLVAKRIVGDAQQMYVLKRAEIEAALEILLQPLDVVRHLFVVKLLRPEEQTAADERKVEAVLVELEKALLALRNVQLIDRNQARQLFKGIFGRQSHLTV